jgi:pSer/pThr/pTyr-binding forkhead associated (FHA) protein
VPRDSAPQGRYLEVEHEDQIHLIPLDQPIIHLGRGIAADIRIEDPEVSRRHAIIAQRGDGARVLDDRSRNGTFVNGRPVTVGYLGDGDVLRLGRIVFRFIEVAPPREAVRPLRRIGLAVRGRRSIVTEAAA